jgi:hypothetical protein
LRNAFIALCKTMGAQIKDTIAQERVLQVVRRCGWRAAGEQLLAAPGSLGGAPILVRLPPAATHDVLRTLPVRGRVCGAVRLR